jgi:hypothetical protein
MMPSPQARSRVWSRTWNREEMRNHGTDPHTRMRLMGERVGAMKAIWTHALRRLANVRENPAVAVLVDHWPGRGVGLYLARQPGNLAGAELGRSSRWPSITDKWSVLAAGRWR